MSIQKIEIDKSKLDFDKPKGLIASWLYQKGFSSKGAEVVSTILITILSAMATFILTSLGISATVVV